ncbi:hypothetical protein EDB86DRAFT_2825269 [Lactarius hatsudake]|nr:hypothetical protein EDB86DRAFT_2825269 [Lactarius hatsudake]
MSGWCGGLVVAGALHAMLKGHGGVGVGGGWGLACCVEGVWLVSSVGGVEVSSGRALHAVLGWHSGGLAVEVLCAVLGWHGGLAVVGCWGRDGSGLCAQMACNVQAKGLPCHVGAVRWVGGGGVLGQDGGGLCPQMACNIQGEQEKTKEHILYIGSKVLCAMCVICCVLTTSEDGRGVLKGRVWGGWARGGSGSTGHCRPLVHLCKMEDVAEDKLGFGPNA